MWTWHWWLFFVALIPCIVVGQFRAGMVAERTGQTRYAMARSGQVILWSILFGAMYAAIFTAVIGFLF